MMNNKMFFKILERKKGKKSKKMLAKDVHETEKKRSLKRKRSHPKSEKILFSLFNLQTKQVEKRKRDEGDLALIHGKINHKTSTEVTKRKTFLIDVRSTSLSIAQSGRPDANEMLPPTMQFAIQGAHLQHPEAWIKQGDVHSQKNGKSQTHGETTTNSKTSQRNKRCTRTLTTEDES